MKKIVSYLMLLLCVFLFPFRVRGLEIPEEENTEVIVENVLNEENINDLEDLVKIEDPQDVLREVKSLDEDNNEELNTLQDDEEQDEEEKPSEILGEGLEEELEELDEVQEENEEDDDDNQIDDSQELPQVIEISELSITGVPNELVGGEAFTFGGVSANEELYSIVREDWVQHGEISQIYTSDPNYNKSLPEDYEYIEAPEADNYYHYQVLLKVKEGYELSEDFTLMINGSECYAMIYDIDFESNTYLIFTNHSLQAKNTEIEYIEVLDIENVNTDAYIGQSPLYGATSSTEHITVIGELWTYYIESGSEEDYEYHVYTNASDSSLLEEYENPFDKFEADHVYSYIIVADAENGYQLAYTNGSNNTQNYKITINGEEKDCEVYGWIQEDGTYRYYIYVLDKTPTEVEEYEVTDNQDPVVTEGEIEDVVMTVDSEESELEAVYVDNELISEENYTTEGNTLLTLLASFLNTLGQGIHNIAMKFSNGNMAYTTITIESNEQEVTEPVATQMAGNSTQEVSATPMVNTIEEEEKEEDHKLEVKEKEELEEEEEKEDSNTGLIIFLIILIIIAIIIPITLYRKNN